MARIKDSSSSAWKAKVVFWCARSLGVELEKWIAVPVPGKLEWSFGSHGPLDRLGIELEKWSEESDIK